MGDAAGRLPHVVASAPSAIPARGATATLPARRLSLASQPARSTPITSNAVRATIAGAVRASGMKHPMRRRS